jgi:hypothetical protein
MSDSAETTNIPTPEPVSPERKVVQIAISDSGRERDMGIVHLAKLWSDGSITIQCCFTKGQEELTV